MGFVILSIIWSTDLDELMMIFFCNIKREPPTTTTHPPTSTITHCTLLAVPNKDRHLIEFGRMWQVMCVKCCIAPATGEVCLATWGVAALASLRVVLLLPITMIPFVSYM
jgi:hypothetical protein